MTSSRYRDRDRERHSRGTRSTVVGNHPRLQRWWLILIDSGSLLVASTLVLPVPSITLRSRLFSELHIAELVRYRGLPPAEVLQYHVLG